MVLVNINHILLSVQKICYNRKNSNCLEIPILGDLKMLYNIVHSTMYKWKGLLKEDKNLCFKSYFITVSTTVVFKLHLNS